MLLVLASLHVLWSLHFFFLLDYFYVLPTKKSATPGEKEMCLAISANNSFFFHTVILLKNSRVEQLMY